MTPETLQARLIRGYSNTHHHIVHPELQKFHLQRNNFNEISTGVRQYGRTGPRLAARNRLRLAQRLKQHQFSLQGGQTLDDYDTESKVNRKNSNPDGYDTSRIYESITDQITDMLGLTQSNKNTNQNGYGQSNSAQTDDSNGGGGAAAGGIGNVI